MPKKTRKMKQRAAERRSAQQGTPRESAPAMPTPAAEVPAPARVRTDFATARTVTPLTYDYSHIYSDLKRIALFAGFFFAVLIILAFVIK
jgi:hypothetical protein